MLEDLLIDELFSDEHQYALDHRGHTFVTVIENSGLIATTVRLFVDGHLIDSRRAFSTTVRIPAEIPSPAGSHRIEIKVRVDLLGEVKSCTLIDGRDRHPMSRVGKKS